ncbi:hypothetical protein [Cytobacillus massiliigabonensis]|uniref:hypothetical protein n=1 Tax=Cytobacillus massiliigabonensis TaxID=1871011 RepID=UPI000C855702|nr:hypothetical protein [Cytobacillus massiliigabonensis]
MWNSRKSRIAEVLIIVVIGALVSVVNTLWLREDLLKKIQLIAKSTESNIVNSKVTDISTRMNP